MLRLALRYISRRISSRAGLFVWAWRSASPSVVAIDIANESASRAFTLSSESIVGRATHQIVGGPNGFDSELCTRDCGWSWAFKLSAPVVTEFVRVGGSEGALRLLGVDPMAEAPFRSYLADEDDEQVDYARPEPPHRRTGRGRDQRSAGADGWGWRWKDLNANQRRRALQPSARGRHLAAGR